MFLLKSDEMRVFFFVLSFWGVLKLNCLPFKVCVCLCALSTANEMPVANFSFKFLDGLLCVMLHVRLKLLLSLFSTD